MGNIPNTVKARATQHSRECSSDHFTYLGYQSFKAKHLILFNCEKCQSTLSAKVESIEQRLTGEFSL